MAQQQNKQNRPKQPQDPYAQQHKQLASVVQRLRGWVGSDPSRTPELADALVTLTEHRLLGHAYTVAAPDAQESVKLAGQLLTANGPIGPYTSVADAARYVSAVVHLAVIQSAAGMAREAADTVGSLAELREELGALPLVEALPPTTVVWLLSCAARGALAGGEVAEANAYVDAALARLAEADLRSRAETAYVVIDTDRLTSDARWAAGATDDALTHLHAARDSFDAVVDGRLAQPGRLSPALVQRLSEPLYGLYRDLADRLVGVGEIDLGVVTRRQLVELLRAVAPKDETARIQLAASLASLDRDLREHDRVAEADLVAEELDGLPAADRTAAATLSDGIERGSAVRWEPLDAVAAYAGAGATEGAGAAAEAELRREAAERLTTERAEAQRLERVRQDEARLAAERRQAERAEADKLAAERREAEQAEQARREFERIEAERVEAARLAAEQEAERQERKRRREERIEEHRREQERAEAERLEEARLAMERREAQRRAADPAEIERLELERLQAEIAELERAEAAAASEPVVAEPEPIEPIEPAPVESQAVEPAPVEEQQVIEAPTEPEPVEPAPELPAPVESEPESVEDELTTTHRAWQEARSRGDRKLARALNERVVELLRPRAEQDLADYGPRLLYALEELSSARLRSGELFASRGPAREAKSLAKALGRR